MTTPQRRSSGPRIDPTAWVAPTATVRGDVTVGAQSGIWFSAVVRADTEAIAVGSATNIQDGCVLHADPGYPLTVGDHVSVGHGALLHGCAVENEVLIGMGAIIMNGARIGAGSLIGAGTLIPESTIIPPGSLVIGSPGKLRRPVTDEERQFIRDNARQYVVARLDAVRTGRPSRATLGTCDVEVRA